MHPEVDPRTNAGLVRGITAYYNAVNLCNALNGFTVKEEFK